MFRGFDLRMIISYIINLNIQGIMEILKMVILDLSLLLIFFGLNKDSIIIVQIKFFGCGVFCYLGIYSMLKVMVRLF